MSIPFGTPDAQRPFINLDVDRCSTIICTLRLGWARALKTRLIDIEWHEVPITECLRDGMREALREALGTASDMWVSAGAESRSTPGLLEPDGRTDIPIAFTSIRERLNEHNAHAIIECKRVAEDSASLCKAYVEQGIRRFVGGAKADPRYPKYAANHAVAFMAGYLLRGTTAGAVKRINGYLGKMEHLGPPTVVREDWVRTSVHKRSRLSDIILHHAFLAIHRACSPPPGPRQ